MIVVTTLCTTLVLTLTVVHAAPPPPTDCGYGRCPRPVCPHDNVYTPAGTCCPVCGQDCRLVRCASPICAKGQEPYKPPGNCCKQCPPIDCNSVDCREPICLDSEELYTPDGECCQQCRPIDCSRVICPLPKCLDGQELYTPTGKCCRTCRYIKKEGTCPKPGVFGSCSGNIHMCVDDWGCPGKQKCCSNGCGGTVCSIPRRKCHNVICLACVGYTPPGACCPICGTGYPLGSAGDPPPSA